MDDRKDEFKVLIAIMAFCALCILCLTVVEVVKVIRKEPVNVVPITAPAE